MLYKLFIPKQAVGANLPYFDCFNLGGTGCEVFLRSCIPVVSAAVAVTGVVGVDLHLTRTTAVGTGGTAATSEGTDLTAATFSAYDCQQPLAASLGISARLTPSGGATAGAWLAWTCVFTEETVAYVPAGELVRAGRIPIFKGTGFRVAQGSVASVGNIGFDITIEVNRL